MIECHNHDKIMDSLFEEEDSTPITKEKDSTTLWKWLVSIMRW